jgi:ribosomal protein S18 acetylase RimI-like enzyme
LKIQDSYGYCEYAFEHDSFGDYVHIYNLFVCPEFRRQGHAKDLLRTAVGRIRETGYKGEIQIVAKPADDSIPKEKLREFYKKMGLEVFDYYMIGAKQ